jgi:hypothetical protein
MLENERRKIANFVAGGQGEPLLPLANPLLQQAATLGEAGLATVARFRPLSRAVFSYLYATELLAQPQVQDALKDKAATAELVDALRTLSPHRMLEAAHGGKVPKGLLLVLNHVSETRGLTEYDAKRIANWLSPRCSSDKHRGRLLLEALQTRMQNDEPQCMLDFSLMVANIRDLPDQSLDLLRFRELRTIRELTQKHGGADKFEVTINHVASVCSTFKQRKDQIAQDLRAGKPLGAVLRQILEDHADDLPKPWFPAHAELEVLKPNEARQLAVEWQNCIREVWIDPMLAGDITFVRSKAYLLVARLRRVTGQNGHEMWLLEETAAPNNELADPGHIVNFIIELQRGNVVVMPERERICDFMRSVIARRPYL